MNKTFAECVPIFLLNVELFLCWFRHSLKCMWSMRISCVWRLFFTADYVPVENFLRGTSRVTLCPPKVLCNGYVFLSVVYS